MKMRRRGLGYSRRMYLRAAVRSLLGPALALMWAASTAAQTDPTLDPTLDPNSDGGSDMLWMVGIVMEVCSAISGAIAKQLLRYYGKRNEILDAATGKMVHAATLKRPASIESESSDPMMTPKKKARWAMIIGLFLEFAVGPLLDMSAYAFAPASLIAPLASVQLLVNIVMAPHTLGKLDPQNSPHTRCPSQRRRVLMRGAVLSRGEAAARARGQRGHHHDRHRRHHNLRSPRGARVHAADSGGSLRVRRI